MASKSSAPHEKTRSPESFESQRARDNAVEILESYEKLSWVSFSRYEVGIAPESISTGCPDIVCP
jgi:hypothetical protein